MREGYKETAVGWIPEEWEIMKFGDTCLNITEKFKLEQGKCIDLEHIEQGAGKISGYEEISSSLSSKNYFRTNDILFGKLRPYLKKYWLAEFNGACSSELLIFRAKDGYSPKYLFYQVQTGGFIQNAVGTSFGTKMPRSNWATIAEYNVIVPPLPEQSKIASILSTVDDKIDSINKRIEETRKLKQGLMQRLLTQGIGHTKFKDSPLGRIPEGWEVVRICDIAEVKGGKRLPKGKSLVEQQTPYPYIRVSDMFMGGINPINILYVPENIQKTIRRYTIGKDDLFISVAGTLGLVGKIPPELDGANLTENADKLTNIKCNRYYLLQVLMSNIIQDSIQNESTSNAQPKLALTRIQQFEIPLPSLPEQSEIASILSSTDIKIENLTRINTEYDQLKKGLMQQLLTGRMRVIASRSPSNV